LNEIDRKEESFDRLRKIKKYWKFHTAYFQKFTKLPKIRQQKIYFSLQRKGSFQTMYCPEIQNVLA
jgi:hypothetical protein